MTIGKILQSEKNIQASRSIRVPSLLIGAFLAFAIHNLSQAQFIYSTDYSNQPALATINALPAYQQGITGSKILIGIIDSGITPNHASFNGSIMSGIGWRRTDSQLDVDNWTPYYVSRSANNLNLLTDLKTDYSATEGHGTFVSSIAAGRPTGTRDMIGVAYNANIALGTVYFHKEVNGVITQQGLSDEQFAQAIRFVADQRPKVINNSWGESASWNISMEARAQKNIADGPNTINALKYAQDKGAVIVFAAGNDSVGWPGPPATLPSVDESVRQKGGWIVVAATTVRGVNPSTNQIEMAQTRPDLTAPADDGDYYTNYCGAAKLYCISAPGGLNGVPDDIAIKDKGIKGATAPTTDGYSFGNGTSYASPLVAGAVALVSEVFPWMTNKNLATTILTTGTTAENPSEIWGRGLLDVGRAIKGPGIFEETFDANVTAEFSSTFGNNISGTAGLDKRGAGRLIMSGASTYTGATGIYAGTLQVTGSISSSTVTVFREGTLTGSGTVGPTTVAGTIAPGNSPGTLTIAGNYLQQAGGIYEYEIDGQGKTDLISVQGNATIESGSILRMMNPLRMRLNTGYSLLTATDGIVGQNNFSTPNYILLNQNFSITTNGSTSDLQYLLTRNDKPMRSFGTLSNQHNMADALDQLQSSHPLFTQVMLTTDRYDLRNTLNRLNGEIYASTLSTLINQSNLVLQPVTNRLQNAFHRTGLSDGAQTLREYGPDKAVWGQALGGWGKLSGGTVAQGVNSGMGGLLIGSDVALTPNSRLGLSGGVTSTRVSNDDASSYTTGYHLLAYGGIQGNRFGLRGGVGQSWYTTSANRNLPFEYDRVSGNTNSNSTQLFVETDISYSIGATNFRPFIGLTQLWMRSNAFSEAQTNFVRLNANASQNNVTFSTVGLRADRTFETKTNQISINGMLGWRNASGAVSPSTTMQLDFSNPYSVAGAPIAKNALVLELSIGAEVAQNTTVNLSYGGQFGSGAQSNTLQAGLVYRF
ncbi:autotransporter domain-containing protein [Orrella sp. NBD-18]|uniref:Autotransporter domain-containing protein n=1 Tax=Sheuella amnicola TaxID=2707330 RepID=A0A6B2QZ47_9BURK|nr:autotransporter serine protease [Sheuella amnicola]NDY83282.1 autotransporter domain-containing protein [Sheuella amnicola]